MQDAQALAAIGEELDVLGDVVAELDAKVGEMLSLLHEMRGMLVKVLDAQGEIPELRRRLVHVEDQLDAAE